MKDNFSCSTLLMDVPLWQ